MAGIRRDLFTSRAGHRPYLVSIIGLLGHLIGTAVLFVSLFSLGWCVAFSVHWLNGIHPFPTEVLKFIDGFELYWLYLDTGFCALVVLAGMFRFCKDVLRGEGHE